MDGIKVLDEEDEANWLLLLLGKMQGQTFFMETVGKVEIFFIIPSFSKETILRRANSL